MTATPGSARHFEARTPAANPEGGKPHPHRASREDRIPADNPVSESQPPSQCEHQGYDRLVSQAPPLSAEQRQRDLLVAVLRPASARRGEAA